MIFLCTTAIKQFWNLKHPNPLLAGEWCKIYRDTQVERLNTFPFLWDSAKDVYKAQVFCESIYKNTLPFVRKELNKYLNLKEKNKYYHIILGNWLIHFIHQAYDKYRLIEEISKSGSVETYIMDSEQYYYPFNFLDYQSKTLTDLYQLQLFSEVVKYMDISFKVKRINFDKLTMTLSKKNTIQKIKEKIALYKYSLYNYSKNNEAIIVGPYFKKHSHLYEFLIWMNSRGKISFNQFNPSYEIDFKRNNLDFRNQYEGKSKYFEDWIMSFVMKNIPKSYLENHHDFIKFVSKIQLSKKVKCFLTYNDIYHNTNFQFFVAKNYKTFKFYSAQHGCGYGMDRRHEGEVFERSISDIFFTYGWTESKKTKPLPMPNLTKGKKKNRNRKNILFCTTARARYVQRFFHSTFSSKMLIDCVQNPIAFLTHLDKLDELLIRHQSDQEDCGWNNRQRIIDIFPDIKEDPNKSFYNSLNNCKMFVSDHIGTSFLEAMQSNTPCVLFINKSTYLFRKDFKPFVKKMIQEKILFHEPQMAAQHINQVYKDVQNWWGSESIQSLIKSFVKYHAYTSKNWINIWCDELIKGD